jgi:tRNA modification GTPase
LDDTIVAIATPPGQGGVGIIRLSGPCALTIAQAIFFPKQASAPWTPAFMLYGDVRQDNEVLDDGLAVYFQNPHSFTGQDVVELQLHGSPYVLSKVVGLCQTHGARLAQPGEFTQRAFLLGKMDLLQAEAVSELIHAQSEEEARRSRMRLDGKLSDHVEQLRASVIDVLAQLEADVDFPEEVLPIEQQTVTLQKIKTIEEKALALLETYQANAQVRDGVRIALMGAPNVGKSSFFNQVLGQDRAIVTDQAGTTRDVLREEVHRLGRRIHFIDTAGLRENTEDLIEKEGMTRARHEVLQADKVCLLVSHGEPSTPYMQELFEQVPVERRWIIATKADLTPMDEKAIKWPRERFFSVSNSTGKGFSEFWTALDDYLEAMPMQAWGGGISNDRQKERLLQVVEACKQAHRALSNQTSPDLVAFECRQIYRAVSEMLGLEADFEDVFDQIFSTFCIGK